MFILRVVRAMALTTAVLAAGCASTDGATACTVGDCGSPTDDEEVTAQGELFGFFDIRGETPVAGKGAVTVVGNSFPSACNSAGCTVLFGGAVTVTATASTGNRFDGWSGCSTSKEASIKLTNISTDATCTASFSGLRPSVTAVANATYGSVTTSCGAATCSVDFGGTVALSATANTGYRFASWEGAGCADSTSQRSFLSIRNVTGDLTCRARFTPIVYTAYLISNPRYLIPDEGHNAPYGSPTVFTVPKVVQGYTFSNFSGCAGSPTTTKYVASMPDGASFETATITGTVQCVANYVPTK
ncbi:MAG: Divergent InlB B-repeat domain [Pseudomonadota bacterium]